MPLKAYQTKVQKEFLRVNLKKGKIDSHLNVIKYQDKDTNQIVCYIPSLEITGYGSDEKRALDMLHFSVEEFYSFLNDLSPEKIETELFKLGWKHNKLQNKEYSKAYIDLSGQLKNLNAVDNEVEMLTLEV